jgi:hypothetical protein
VSADETIDQIRERAVLYALGVLPAEEAREVEGRIAAGDQRYRDEVAVFRSVTDELAHAAPPLTPPASARQRVLDRIATGQAPVVEQRGLRFVRGRELDWRPGVGPGVEFKTLTIDPERGRFTALVRMAPGTHYPNHRHRDVEELYLLEGDLIVNGVPMAPGDYCSANPDTLHDGIRTVRGCTFIASAGVSDEYVA